MCVNQQQQIINLWSQQELPVNTQYFDSNRGHIIFNAHVASFCRCVRAIILKQHQVLEESASQDGLEPKPNLSQLLSPMDSFPITTSNFSDSQQTKLWIYEKNMPVQGGVIPLQCCGFKMDCILHFRSQLENNWTSNSQTWLISSMSIPTSNPLVVLMILHAFHSGKFRATETSSCGRSVSAGSDSCPTSWTHNFARWTHIWEHQMEILQNDTPTVIFLGRNQNWQKIRCFPLLSFREVSCHNVAGGGLGIERAWAKKPENTKTPLKPWTLKPQKPKPQTPKPKGP